MIDLTVHPEALKHTVERARERNIRIPTFKQMRHPELIPEGVVKALKNVGLWDVDPLNLYRITWHNEPVEKGGGFGKVNYIEFPEALTGVPCKIVGLAGKWFPTGAHKVGAAFGCLVPRLVTGQFDPTCQKAVWPSTGNYCRGGAYDSALLGCKSIAILPEGMSKERFEWLKTVAGEIIATPGCESNVKEIFDKCWELRKSGENLVIFNQFEEFGNYLWHYHVTGPAMDEVVKMVGGNYRGMVSATGSAGTIAAGDYMKDHYPTSKIAASEAIQCPTLLMNGFGGHRIEGIGDKHVPWVHNVKNTDMVIAIDDEAPCSLLRLLNEPNGAAYLESLGLSHEFVQKLTWLGISSISNLLSAIKMAKYYELGPNDIIVTMLTDSAAMYQSRLREMTEERGSFTAVDAAVTDARYFKAADTDHMLELTYQDRKRVHNLKYYTWVEQQGKTYKEIQEQWYNEEYWTSLHQSLDPLDKLIEEFNTAVGLKAL
ncbi:pyridoxal-phosphate dependent enzyme [bacterium]|nr:pyridoxal-phosphate dependent enzyme [bacterium]